MGEVWAGQHIEGRTPVAVKMVISKRARNPHYLSLFRNEVRVAAGLAHPSIVTVFDQGLVPEQAERLTGGRLLAGSPFLVMERVDGGSLGDLPGRLAWSELRRVLLEILEALAHAHARAVIHCDLKPTNVLLMPGARNLKLTDFGLAHALQAQGGERSDRFIAGTPAYMAPEQFEGRSGDYGPSTDLYSLGCVAFYLSTGKPPFGDARDVETLWAGHLYEPPPPVDPKLPVPAGFEGWIRRLLMKEPDERFQCAADAAAALRAIAPDERDGSARTAPLGLVAAIDSTMTSMATLPASTMPAQPADHRTWRAFATSEPPAAIMPPVPESWRAPHDSAAPKAAMVTRLAMHGLRTIPLVDRETERDRLWASLREVHETRRAGAVVVRGAAGCGKSRLAEWLCERAHEVGAATTLKAVHGAVPGPGDGLLPMFARYLRVAGLSRSEVVARTEAVFRHRPSAAIDARTLGELLWRAGSERVGMTEHAEEHVLIMRLLGLLSSARSIVMWLDDVQWGRASLEFALRVMESQKRFPCPILLVLTAREEALVDHPAEAELLAELLRGSGCTELLLGPLPRAYWPALVEDRLGLSGELAVRVEERTAGNPLFAIQLVSNSA
jgi:hypothetical protein